MVRPDPPAPSTHPLRPAGGALSQPRATGARWLGPILAVFALSLLYAGAIRTGFLNDDYIFLDKTRSASFASLWAPKDLAFHWYRPWSRELHYWTLQKVFGTKEAPFHVVSFLIALASLLAFFALVRRLAGVRVAAIATAGWAALAAWAVPIVWVAGVQDLWMLLFAFLCLGALALGWAWVSGLLFLLALLSKESAAVLPAIAVGYELLVARRGPRESFQRTLPPVGAR